jgi:hypothetical protein
MRQILNFARVAALALLLAPFGAAAQQANTTEQEIITGIGQCLVQGLPEDWVAAHMIVELPSPGAVTGNVRYVVARKGAEDKLESFTPCDTDMPARMLVELRDKQPPERQGWTSARLVVERDGSFRVNYDFPPK